jgi:SAM-dependent methyltransferase
MTISIIFIIIVATLFVWNISLIISAIYGAPTVYAKQENIAKAFQLAGLTQGKTVLDIGCGNARSLIIASRTFKASGIGIEISPFYYCLAKLNVFIAGQSKNIKIYFGDIKRHSGLYKEADVIFIYLLEKLMSQIETEVFAKAKPKTKIVTIAFEFKKHEPYKTTDSPRLFLYKI